MFRTLSTVVVVVMAVVGNLAVATAAEPKTDGKTKGPPKELTLDLGKGVKLEMVLISAGEFLMGSVAGEFADEHPQYPVRDSVEHPQHRVRITKPFYLGKYPVTQEQWEAVMGNNPSYFKGARNPVERVSWDDCQKFFQRLNDQHGVAGRKFRLPTEAEWEYACRAGSTGRWCFGDYNKSQLDQYAWYSENSEHRTHPVGEKKSNAWGLYDMYGNVFEWCQDWFDEGYYKVSPLGDPTGPTSGSRRVVRGGSWNAVAWACRSAGRGGLAPGNHDSVGLRVSQVPADK